MHNPGDAEVKHVDCPWRNYPPGTSPLASVGSLADPPGAMDYPLFALAGRPAIDELSEIITRLGRLRRSVVLTSGAITFRFGV